MVSDDDAPAMPPEGPRDRAKMAIAVVVVSVLASAFAIVFRWSLALVHAYVFGASDVVEVMRSAPVWVRLALPAVGGLLAGVCALVVARRGPSQNVGDVMEAIVIGRTRLAFRATVWKSLGSWFAIVSGGSLGREGPLIQFGGAAGDAIGHRAGFATRRVRILIAAGTAAGFAAAYNTPFAAVLFVLEVVTGVAMLEALVPTLVATVIATGTTRAVIGGGPLYGVRAFVVASPYELFAFALLGVACALAAVAFMWLLERGEALFHRTALTMPLRPALGGLAAGGVIALIPEVAGNGYEPLARILDGSYALGFVACLLAAKCIATTASVASGSPGGIFTPSMLVGGCVGALFGAAMHALFGAGVGAVGGYALVGMAATTAATTHAPLMAAVMAFELSSDYAIVLPLMLATAVSASLARAIRRDSVYTAELTRRGVGWSMTLEGRRLHADERD